MLRSFSVCAAALALAAAALCAAKTTSAQRVIKHHALVEHRDTAASEAIDEANTISLSGNTHPLAQADNDEGQAAAGTALEGMILLLSPTSEQEAELDRLLAAQRDPASSSYRRWLTPAEFGARFGASARKRAQVGAWLGAHGFSVDAVAASGRYLVFSGTEAAFEEAFHTTLHRYAADGVSHLANADDPQIPAALAGSIAGLVSLNDFRSASMLARRTQIGSGTTAGGLHALYSAGSTHYLFPEDFATIYDLSPLYTAGLKGSGVTIAIAARSNIKTSDVASFRSLAGLAANAPTVILPGADPGTTSSDRDEATLDVEWTGAVAPLAKVVLVAAPSTATTDGIDTAAAYIVDNAVGSIVSVSYSNCESAMGSTKLAFYNALWKQAAAQGQTVLVSSGDAGAAGCQAGSATKGSAAAVNGMCSSPYATCVGGTEFNEGSASATYWSTSNSSAYGSALSYIPEKVWNESASDSGSGLWASGGGVSTIYAQPDWQAGVDGASAANGMRAVPDLSLSAAAHDGAMVVEDGVPYAVSGTSVSAPALAGILALAVEKTGAALGNANSRLYALAASLSEAFHPTPSGNNTVPGVSGYTAAGATYNLATGLGSVDAAVLVNHWAVTSCPTSLRVSNSSCSLSVPVNLRIVVNQY